MDSKVSDFNAMVFYLLSALMMVAVIVSLAFGLWAAAAALGIATIHLSIWGAARLICNELIRVSLASKT